MLLLYRARALYEKALTILLSSEKDDPSEEGRTIFEDNFVETANNESSGQLDLQETWLGCMHEAFSERNLAERSLAISHLADLLETSAVISSSFVNCSEIDISPKSTIVDFDQTKLSESSVNPRVSNQQGTSESTIIPTFNPKLHSSNHRTPEILTIDVFKPSNLAQSFESLEFTSVGEVNKVNSIDSELLDLPGPSVSDYDELLDVQLEIYIRNHMGCSPTQSLQEKISNQNMKPTDAQSSVADHFSTWTSPNKFLSLPERQSLQCCVCHGNLSVISACWFQYKPFHITCINHWQETGKCDYEYNLCLSCMRPMPESNAIDLGCGHYFHSECVKKKLTESGKKLYSQIRQM